MSFDAVSYALGTKVARGGLPPVTDTDDGKVLTVVDGAWTAAANEFVVTFTKSGNNWSADRTWTQVSGAYAAGKRLVGLVNGSSVTTDSSIKSFQMILPLSGYNELLEFVFGGAYQSQSQTVFCTIVLQAARILAYTKTVSIGTYSKPSGGIPATDLAAAVQASLIPAGGTAGQALLSDGNGGVYWGDLS